MPADVKMDYIQDARYCLLSEKYAYSTQRKYAKIAQKKNYLFYKEDLNDENKNFMFDEKIKLLNELGFEIIKKERLKHTRKLNSGKNFYSGIKKCKDKIKNNAIINFHNT